MNKLFSRLHKKLICSVEQTLKLNFKPSTLVYKMHLHHTLYEFLQANPNYNPNYNPKSILGWVQQNYTNDWYDDDLLCGFCVLNSMQDAATIQYCCRKFMGKYKMKHS